MLEALRKRVAALLGAIEQSAGQHNALLGRLAEAKDLLMEAEKDAAALLQDGKDVLDLVEGKALNLEQEKV